MEKLEIPCCSYCTLTCLRILKMNKNVENEQISFKEDKMLFRRTRTWYGICALILYFVSLYVSIHLNKWVWPGKVKHAHHSARMTEKLDTGPGTTREDTKKGCNSTLNYPADPFRGLPKCFEKCEEEQHVTMNWTEPKKAHSTNDGKPKIFVSLSVCWDRNTKQYRKQNFPYQMALR